MKSNYSVLKDHYEDCLATKSDWWKKLDWDNEANTVTRYTVMLSNVTPKSSVLDFGCGLGSIVQFVNPTCLYTGIDISNNFIADAISNYKSLSRIVKLCDARFITQDILNKDLDESYDHVICNGVFTIKKQLPHSDMFNFVKSCLDILWRHTDKTLAFNVMDSHKIDLLKQREDLFFMTADDAIVNLIKPLNPKGWDIKANYGCYDSTYIIYR